MSGRESCDVDPQAFVKRIERRASHRGKISNEYDLQGLVDKLAEIEPDFREAAEGARAARKAAAGRGMRKRPRAVTSPAKGG